MSTYYKEESIMKMYSGEDHQKRIENLKVQEAETICRHIEQSLKENIQDEYYFDFMSEEHDVICCVSEILRANKWIFEIKEDRWVVRPMINGVKYEREAKGFQAYTR